MSTMGDIDDKDNASEQKEEPVTTTKEESKATKAVMKTITSLWCQVTPVHAEGTMRNYNASSYNAGWRKCYQCSCIWNTVMWLQEPHLILGCSTPWQKEVLDLAECGFTGIDPTQSTICTTCLSNYWKSLQYTNRKYGLFDRLLTTEQVQHFEMVQKEQKRNDGMDWYQSQNSAHQCTSTNDGEPTPAAKQPIVSKKQAAAVRNNSKLGDMRGWQ
jgi:hypothetical protein